ncbi:hypothetical protein [Oleidesulfovibrio sp.]
MFADGSQRERRKADAVKTIGIVVEMIFAVSAVFYPYGIQTTVR